MKNKGLEDLSITFTSSNRVIKKVDRDSVSSSFNLIKKYFLNPELVISIDSLEYSKLVRDIVQGTIGVVVTNSFPIEEISKCITAGVISMSFLKDENKDILNHSAYLIGKELVVGSIKPKYSINICVKALEVVLFIYL